MIPINKELGTIKELKEAQDYEEANKLLNKGWTLITISYNMQRCYNKVEERIVQFVKQIKIYILGKCEK